MLRGTVENIPRSRSRSRGAQARPVGSPQAARGFPEGNPNMSFRSPYARMESSDPLRRRQATIRSLIDFLAELSGDDALDTGSSFSYSRRFRTLTDLFRCHLASGAGRGLA